MTAKDLAALAVMVTMIAVTWTVQKMRWPFPMIPTPCRCRHLHAQLRIVVQTSQLYQSTLRRLFPHLRDLFLAPTRGSHLVLPSRLHSCRRHRVISHGSLLLQTPFTHR